MNPLHFLNTTNRPATTNHCLNVRECPWSRNTTRDRCSSGLQQLLITSRGNISNQNEPIIVNHDRGTNGYV